MSRFQVELACPVKPLTLAQAKIICPPSDPVELITMLSFAVTTLPAMMLLELITLPVADTRPPVNKLPPVTLAVTDTMVPV